jgi:hypothetical protein
MPRKRKRKKPPANVLICIDKVTFARFTKAANQIAVAVAALETAVFDLSQLLTAKRRQVDAGHKAHETRERNAEATGRIQAELNRAALDAASPANGPRHLEEGGGS